MHQITSGEILLRFRDPHLSCVKTLCLIPATLDLKILKLGTHFPLYFYFFIGVKIFPASYIFMNLFFLLFFCLFLRKPDAKTDRSFKDIRHASVAATPGSRVKTSILCLSMDHIITVSRVFPARLAHP